MDIGLKFSFLVESLPGFGIRMMWRKIYKANGKQKKKKKKAGVAILISDKTDCKATKIKRDKEGHYIMVKGSMQQEELTILNI